MNIYLLTLNGFGQYCFDCGPESMLVIAESSERARSICASEDPEREDRWLYPKETHGPMSDCLKLGETTRLFHEKVLLVGERKGYDDNVALAKKCAGRSR